MASIINGSSPTVTFSDGTTQATAGLPLTGGTVTGNLTTSGLIVGTTALGAGNATRFKNRIINGDMRIDQRNAGASVTPASSSYLVDRWQIGMSQASKFTAQQNAGSVTPPVGFSNYLGVTVASAVTIGAGDYFYLTQYIEGYNIADLGWGTANAKTITISFWVRSSLTGTFGGGLINSAFNRGYPFTYTISSANTWEQKSITISGDTSGTWLTNNGAGIQVVLGLGVGTSNSGTAGAWAATGYLSATGATSVVGTSGATFYITGVQLEVGSSATGFEYVDYTTQLAMCQRYYFAYCNGATDFQEAVSRDNAIYCSFTLRVPVSMRITPSTVLGGSSPYGRIVLYDTSFNLGIVDVTSFSISAASQNLSTFQTNITNVSASGSFVYASFDTIGASNAKIGLNAEL